MFVASGGISALVQALHDGSLRAKAAAVQLLQGFAMDGVDNQEWIGAAPGAIAALVDLLRCSPPLADAPPPHIHIADAALYAALCSLSTGEQFSVSFRGGALSNLLKSWTRTHAPLTRLC